LNRRRRVQPFAGLVLPDGARAVAALIVLASLATVIAAQAVITGAFSLTQQAIQLGLLPRLRVRQTSADFRGQIYLRDQLDAVVRGAGAGDPVQDLLGDGGGLASR
jgi:K+ transporter